MATKGGNTKNPEQFSQNFLFFGITTMYHYMAPLIAKRENSFCLKKESIFSSEDSKIFHYTLDIYFFFRFLIVGSIGQENNWASVPRAPAASAEEGTF